MDKKTKYALNGALLLGIGNAIINAIKQLNQMEVEPDRKFDWRDLLIAGGKGALVGGAGGFVVGAIKDEISANQKTIDTDAYLRTFIQSIQVDKNSIIYRECEKKCEEIMEFIEQEFKDELSTVPFQWDSNIKGTAVKGKSDFDIRVGFRKDSFDIKDMLSIVLERFENKYSGSSVKVRPQGKSIGVIFNILGEEVRIDVVPMRYTDDNPNNTSANLHVSPKGMFGKSTYIKTDISLQASQKLTPTQKKIIQLFKDWKGRNNIPMGSYMLQLFVVKAYEANKRKIPKKLTDKVIMVAKYIRDNIHTSRLISIENTNNDVNNISDYDKNIIESEMNKIVEEYEYHPNTIQEIFSATESNTLRIVA